VVTASAGCSAFLRECDELFPAGSEERTRAAALAERSQDLISWLVREGDPLRFTPSDERVVLQNPCHHRHAQSMVSEAASLLARVPGVEILRAEGEDLCCGSAGSYQLHQPEMSQREREVKLAALRAGTPDRILSANPGCEFFLEAGIEAGGPVVEHLAVFLARQLDTGASG
jgi:glycolate oxidase iron-sulfur subunit